MLQQAAFPRYVGEQRPDTTGAPRLGEHTEEVLTSMLGMTAREIDGLRADDTI
jgi:crotonobetainyl-CoA:carnitine CoA-transferase CaiB-like acyl-CoA transferase